MQNSPGSHGSHGSHDSHGSHGSHGSHDSHDYHDSHQLKRPKLQTPDTQSSAFEFFFLHAYQIPKNRHDIILFGRLRRHRRFSDEMEDGGSDDDDPDTQNDTESCALLISGIEHEAFAIPRLYTSTNTDTKVDYSQAQQLIPEIRDEVSSKLPPFCDVDITERTFCFNDVGNVLPYRISTQLLPYVKITWTREIGENLHKITGQWFSNILPTFSSAEEALLLQKRIKGPCWLDVRRDCAQEITGTSRLTRCQREFACDFKDLTLNQSLSHPPGLLAACISETYRGSGSGSGSDSGLGKGTGSGTGMDTDTDTGTGTDNREITSITLSLLELDASFSVPHPELTRTIVMTAEHVRCEGGDDNDDDDGTGAGTGVGTGADTGAGTEQTLESQLYLFTHLQRLLSHHDPDIIVVYDLSQSFWLELACHINCNHRIHFSRLFSWKASPLTLSTTLPTYPTTCPTSAFGGSCRCGTENFHLGRLVVDTYTLIKMFHPKSRDLSLASIVSEVASKASNSILRTLVRSKYDLLHSPQLTASYLRSLGVSIELTRWCVCENPRDLRDLERSGDPMIFIERFQTLANSLVYCLQNLLFLHTTNALQTIYFLARVTGAPMHQILANRRAKQVDIYLMRGFFETGRFITPPFARLQATTTTTTTTKPSDLLEEKKYGGKVLEYDCTLEKVDSTVCVDFNHLYPSLILEENLCFSTHHRDRETGCFKRSSSPAAAASPSSSLPGVIPGLIIPLLEERRRLKSAIAELRTSGLHTDQLKLLSVQETSIKLHTNCIYGSFGTQGSRFYSAAFANAITAAGRRVLQQTSTYVRESLKLKVVGGTTDSILFRVHASRPDTELSVEKLQQQILSKYKSISIKLECIFRPFLALKKNQYVGKSIDDDDASDSRPRIKGFAGVRRNSARIVNDTLELLIDWVFSDTNQETELLESLRERILPRLARTYTTRLDTSTSTSTVTTTMQTETEQSPPSSRPTTMHAVHTLSDFIIYTHVKDYAKQSMNRAATVAGSNLPPHLAAIQRLETRLDSLVPFDQQILADARFRLTHLDRSTAYGFRSLLSEDFSVPYLMVYPLNDDDDDDRSENARSGTQAIHPIDWDLSQAQAQAQTRHHYAVDIAWYVKTQLIPNIDRFFAPIPQFLHALHQVRLLFANFTDTKIPRPLPGATVNASGTDLLGLWTMLDQIALDESELCFWKQAIKNNSRLRITPAQSMPIDSNSGSQPEPVSVPSSESPIYSPLTLLVKCRSCITLTTVKIHERGRNLLRCERCEQRILFAPSVLYTQVNEIIASSGVGVQPQPQPQPQPLSQHQHQPLSQPQPRPRPRDKDGDLILCKGRRHEDEDDSSLDTKPCPRKPGEHALSLVTTLETMKTVVAWIIRKLHPELTNEETQALRGFMDFLSKKIVQLDSRMTLKLNLLAP